jgi:hypothetical protein
MEAGNRGYVDDRRALRRALQEGLRRAGGPGRGEEIDGNASGPIGLFFLLAVARGVVDQDIDATQRARGRLDVTRDIRAVGEIADGTMHLAAMADDLLARRLELVRPASADGDRSAGGRELQGDQTTDAAAGAGHDDAPALEIECHG